MFDYSMVANSLREKYLESPSDYLHLSCKALNERQNILAVQILRAGKYVYPGNPMLKEQLETLHQVNPTLAKYINTPPSRKIFGIGLSKTGTTSLAESIKSMGYRTVHWVNHTNDNSIVTWPEFLSYDALFDTPVSFLFELLHYSFPEAYFIYSFRDIEKWTNSANRHFHCAKNFAQFKKICLNGNGKGDIVDSALWRMIHLTLYANCSSWSEAYKIHEDRVSNFFSANPSANLLRIDITTPSLSSKEKWAVLRDYLRLKDEQIPLYPFPKENSKTNINQKEDPNFKMSLPPSWRAPFKPKQFTNLLSKACIA